MTMRDCDGVELDVGDVVENVSFGLTVRLTAHANPGFSGVVVSWESCQDYNGGPMAVWNPDAWRKLPAPEAEEVRGWRRNPCDGLWPYASSGMWRYEVIRDGDGICSVQSHRSDMRLDEVVKMVEQVIDPPEAEEKLPPIAAGMMRLRPNDGSPGFIDVARPSPVATQPTEAGAVCAECKAELRLDQRWTTALRGPLCVYCYDRTTLKLQRSGPASESGPGIGTVEPVVDVEPDDCAWASATWES